MRNSKGNEEPYEKALQDIIPGRDRRDHREEVQIHRLPAAGSIGGGGSLFLEETRKKYWDARHNCYAWIIGENGEQKRCSDDGEPSQTAGRPMLDVAGRRRHL